MRSAILIADDDPEDVFFLEKAFSSARILNTCHSVCDGEEVICYLKGEGRFSDRSQFPYPVLLMLDLRMPKMAGLDVLDCLRSSPEHQHLAVIALSGVSENSRTTAAFDKGADAFLVKPVESKDLLSALETIKHLRVKLVNGGFFLERSS